MAKAKKKSVKASSKVSKSKAVAKVIKVLEATNAATPTTPGTFTPEKKAQFLELYAGGGTVRQCAAMVGVSHVTVFNHVRKDEEFKAQFAEAVEGNTDALEDLLHDLALARNPVAIFGMLKARRPQKWRENVNLTAQVNHKHEYTLAIARVMKMEVGITQTKQEA